MITFNCPSCSQHGKIDKNKIPPHLTEVNLKCPTCNATFFIPVEIETPQNDYSAPPVMESTTSVPKAQAGTQSLLTGTDEHFAPPSETYKELNQERFTFKGSAKDLFLIYLVNIALTVLTLGIYRFWAKVKVRKYLYSQAEFLGSRFSYEGTGKEMFFGFLKFLAVFIPLFALLSFLQVNSNPAVAITSSLAFVLLSTTLLPWLYVVTIKYRSYRTSWKNINFHFTGTAKEAFKIALKGSIFILLTFGLYWPFFYVNIQKYVRENFHYGNIHADYSGTGKDLLKSYMKISILFLLIIFAMGFIMAVIGMGGMGGMDAMKDTGGNQPPQLSFIFILMPFLIFLTIVLMQVFMKAFFLNYNINHTTFEGIEFTSTVTFKSLLKLYTVNLFILVFTLGLGFALVKVRNLNYLYENVFFTGNLDFATITQKAKEAGAFGDSVSDFFELDLGYF